MVPDEVILGDFIFYFLPLELTSARLHYYDYNAMIRISKQQCNFCPGFLSFFECFRLFGVRVCVRVWQLFGVRVCVWVFDSL